MPDQPRAALRVKGHAWRGIATNVYGDRCYVCECGDMGFPVRLVENARDDHRGHKAEIIQKERQRG